MSPICSETLNSSCAPRLSALSGIGDCGAAGAAVAGAGCSGAAADCGAGTLAIARSVSMISARFLSSCSASSARRA
jgi:hypothetical protein